MRKGGYNDVGIIRKLLRKLRASFYVFKKAEILQNVVNKEIGGEYDNLCPQCFFNERYQEKAKLKGMLELNTGLRISIYLGGALGDYIVYLQFVDEISSKCKCEVDLFLERIEFGQFVYGKRQGLTIIHDIDNSLFINSANEYDLAVHLDHGITLKHCNLGAIREKAPVFYRTACQIVEKNKADQINISAQHDRESVILRRAKFTGQTKWSKLSCGTAIDMSEMYSSILLETDAFSVMEKYELVGMKYITVNYGADKNMGGTAQTKVLPAATLAGFIAKFKEKNPEYQVIQTGVKNSLPLNGVDQYIFNSPLEEISVILKYSKCHIDSEGGLVHLAAQLSTPCVVSFGPTPSYYYGYPRNENIVSPVCGDCMSVSSRWSVECPRGMQVPVCMQAITDDMILERAEKVLSVADCMAPTIEAMEIFSIPCVLLESHRYAKICSVGPLDTVTFSFAQQARRKGTDVCVFIPTNIDDDIIARREQLLEAGIQVAYGNALTVAKPSHSFDLVICCVDATEEHLWPAIQYECRRLATSEGRIIWYSSKRENYETLETYFKTAT